MILTKDVMDAIKERRSVRKFKNQPINEATLGRIMEAATWAPSAGNIQPWQFYVIHNQEVKIRLKEASLNQEAVVEAPVAVVVCADIMMSSAKYGKRGAELYCLQDTACAIQNMMLAAVAYGLDTVWIGAFDEKKIAAVLQIPAHYRPVAIIPIGYGEKRPDAPSRRPIDEVIHVIR
ncbi:MAG: hypothetical protein PWQ67_736 [Clostridia bacterium]|jgi:nitroreductase|nr:hypothetical protein [Clostridia bacterium]